MLHELNNGRHFHLIRINIAMSFWDIYALLQYVNITLKVYFLIEIPRIAQSKLCTLQLAEGALQIHNNALWDTILLKIASFITHLA